MKAKTMLGLIACASACVSLSAFANTTNGWFGVTVANSDVALSNIATNGVGTVSPSRIDLDDIEQDSALVLTPSSGSITNRTDDIYMIDASVVLNPCSTNDFRDVDVTGAKAGVVAGIDDNDVTNYYGYADSTWYKLTGATVVDPGVATAFRIVLNYRDNEASFMIVDNAEEKWYGPYEMSSGGASSLANIKVWGTGSISSVTGAFEVAVAAYDGKKYGSIAEAVAKADVPTNVQAVDDTGVPQETTATASNGLNLVVCEAMGLPADKTTDDATIKLASSTENSNANMITLAWVKPPAAEAGVEIQFAVKQGDEVKGTYDWNNIQIPMASGTYTIEPSIIKK